MFRRMYIVCVYYVPEVFINEPPVYSDSGAHGDRHASGDPFPRAVG